MNTLKDVKQKVKKIYNTNRESGFVDDFLAEEESALSSERREEWLVTQTNSSESTGARPNQQQFSEESVWQSDQATDADNLNRPAEPKANQIRELSESQAPSPNPMAHDQSLARDIHLTLPEDANKISRELERFETICQHGQVNDAVRLTKLYSALRSSVHYSQCEEKIGQAELASYANLKNLILQEVKPVPIEAWRAVLNPAKADPLATYNQIKELQPNWPDGEIVKFLQPHLPWFTYAQLAQTDWTKSPTTLKQNIIDYLNNTKGASAMGASSVGIVQTGASAQSATSGDCMTMLAQLIEKFNMPPTTATMANINRSPIPDENGGDNETSLHKQIEKLQMQIYRLEASRGERRSSGDETNRAECYFHGRFKKKAFKCRPPCQKFNRQVFTVDMGDGSYSKPPDQRANTNQQPIANQTHVQPNAQPNYAGQQAAVQPNAPPCTMNPHQWNHAYSPMPYALPQQQYVQSIAAIPAVSQPQNPTLAEMIAKLSLTVDGLKQVQSTNHPPSF